MASRPGPGQLLAAIAATLGALVLLAGLCLSSIDLGWGDAAVPVPPDALDLATEHAHDGAWLLVDGGTGTLFDVSDELPAWGTHLRGVNLTAFGSDTYFRGEIWSAYVHHVHGIARSVGHVDGGELFCCDLAYSIGSPARYAPVLAPSEGSADLQRVGGPGPGGTGGLEILHSATGLIAVRERGYPAAGYVLIWDPEARVSLWDGERSDTSFTCLLGENDVPDTAHLARLVELTELCRYADENAGADPDRPLPRPYLVAEDDLLSALGDDRGTVRAAAREIATAGGVALYPRALEAVRASDHGE